MQKHFVATLGSDEIEIRVQQPSDGQNSWRVAIGDRVFEVDAQKVRPGVWSLLCGGRSYTIDLDARKRGTAIICGTIEAIGQLEDLRRKRLAQAVSGPAGGAASGEVVRAPIAGKVVKVLASPGGAVEAGNSVAVLEAMKMENEIKAERGGEVAKVHVEVGQSVDTGDVLITLT